MAKFDTSKLNRDKSLLRLHDSISCDKLMDNGISEFSDNEHMREFKKDVEKQILEKVHPYKIYESGSVKGQWITHLPDPTKPEGRRKIKRNSYERLCQAVIEFYKGQYHMDMTLSELMGEWMIFRRDETSSKPGTVRKNASVWNVFRKKTLPDGTLLEDVKVKTITPKLLYQFFRRLTKDREYTRHAIADLRCVLSGMLAYAVERDIIETNPIRDVDIRRLSYKPLQDKSNDVFTFAEVQKLLAYLEPMDDPYALAIRLDFNLFARVGEIAGLMWENIDIENRTVYICHQINYEPELNDDLTFSEKKMVTENYLKGCTSHGYRTEYLTDEALEVLERARKINPDGKYVFMPFGRPIITITFNKRLKKYCEATGIPYHSSHKIRFYVASTAYNGENLIGISKMMGHSQVNTTLHYLRDAVQSSDCSEYFTKLGTQKTS